MNLKFLKTEFNLNVMRLFSGSAIANVISVLSLVVLARLYTKEQFGYLQVYLSTITTFSIVSAFKYELAIVLPKAEKDSRAVIILSLLSLLVFTFLLSLVFLLFGGPVLGLIKATELQPYVFLLLLGTFFMGLWQTLHYVLIRNKQFDVLARNRVYQVVLTQGVAILWGMTAPSFEGLIIAQVIGFLLASVLVVSQSRNSFSLIERGELKQMLLRYKKFPIVNTPMVFLNTLSVQLPVFMFNRYFSPEIVGLYMMANRLLMTPLRMIGTSVAQVYLQAASEAFHEGRKRLLKIYLQTLRKLTLLVTGPLVVVVLFAPFLVGRIFGNEWHDAGLFMQIMTVYVFFQFITSPISGTFSIINRQEVGFIIILISISTRFIAMYWFRDVHWNMLWAFSVSAALFYLFYIVFIYFFIRRLKPSDNGGDHDDISIQQRVDQ